MSHYDVIIIGGGCVGCSTAKHLAQHRNLDVALVEKEYHLASHQSDRNSGVLHPGFNYEPGSTKARFATEGTTRFKAYAREQDIPLREFGVVVVATDDAEERRLADIQKQADANGVETEIKDEEELREHEPHAEGQAALYCPEAASVDSQQYVYELAGNAKREDVDFYMGYTVQDVDATPSSVEVTTDKGALTGAYLINAAGLYAATVGVGTDYRIVPFRGDYYELVPDRRELCNTMIYPTPDPDLPFLGVHYTRRTDDKVIVGPNAVLAFAREAYENTDFDLGELVKDPMVREGPRSLHVLNAVSPGLTCSLPFGEHIAERTVENL
jgi:L-2-hydroxyglutarate oxidase